MEKKYCKLIMVTSDNNNKYYEMIYEGGDSFTVNYGRVEVSKITLTYPINQWDKLKNSKTKKGYKDVTDLVGVTITESKGKTDTVKDILDSKVKAFIDKMKSYTASLVDVTYSVKADKVSQKQIDEAQRLIDQINNLIKVDKDSRDVDSINILLIDLYTIIPRKIKDVRKEIIPYIDIDIVVISEQDNLDALASQVTTVDAVADAVEKEEVVEDKTFLDILGITMEETTDYADIKYILDQINANNRYYSRQKVERVFKVNKPAEDKRFEAYLAKSKNKRTRHLIHGTRCTSVIPILQVGLKIRPAGNFAFSGKAYGEGNYFSEHAAKSLNYTGSTSDRILLIYEVHMGNEYKYKGWFTGTRDGVSLSYQGVTSKGYDCTYVEAGNGLLNSEIISYHEHQNRIRYIIHLT